MSLARNTSNWSVLREGPDVASGRNSQALQSHERLDGQRSQRGGCGSLSELCCSQIALQLVRGELGSQEQQSVVECLSGFGLILRVWNSVCSLKGDSFDLFCQFQSSEAHAGRLCTEQKSACYLLPLDVDLIGTIRSLNGLNKTFSFEYLTILEVYHPVADLSQLANLSSLRALTLTSPQIHEVVRSWHRSLAADGTRWRDLYELRLPQLKSPMLFYELFRLIPSLHTLEAGMGPDIIAEIPRLSQSIKYVGPIRRELGDAVSETAAKFTNYVVFGLRIGFPCHTMSDSYVYKGQLTTGTPDKQASRKSAVRRPFNKRLKGNTSANQFFGFN